MSFHQNIQPHHHVAIWIASFSLVVASLLLYNSAEVNSTLAESAPPQPSAEAQKFFGAQTGDKEQGFAMPDVCKTPPPAAADIQGLQQQMQQIQAQIQSLSSQMQQLNQQNQNLTPDQQQARQQQVQQLQTQMQQLQAQLQSIQQQMQAKVQTLQQPGMFEPSDDCKVAMVNLAIARMETMQDRMLKEDKFFGVLARVDGEITKIQSLIPQLQSVGVDANTINRINSDITTVKAQEAVLRSFFTKMKSFMSSWIAQAKSDPKSAFDSMKNGGFGANKTDASNASAAADALIKAFQDLATTLDGIKVPSKGGK